MAHLCVLRAMLVLTLFCCVHQAAGRTIFTDGEGFEDTYVSIGKEESYAKGRLYKRSPLLEEIMGPLKRNVRDVDERKRSTDVYQRMKILLSILRLLTRGSPQIEILQFWNWDKTIHIDQVFYVRVKTIWEVQRVIRAAGIIGMRVRATGVGHSRSPLFVDEGNIMMDVRELDRHDGPQIELNNVTSSRDFQTVTAMTGVIEVDLNRFLTDKGVAILAQPLNDQESVGGMVAVSTHGSSWNGLTYSGIVVEMRLMDSGGCLRRFTKERHPKLFKAAMCNLGMFGIMYDITIKVVPTFIVKVENQFVPLKDLILSQDTLKSVVSSHFLTEISWFPFNSVQNESAVRYENTGEIPESWSVGNDEVWLRTIKVATQEELVGQDILGPTYMSTGGSLSGGSAKGLLRGRGSLNVAKGLKSKSFHYVVNAFPVILPPRWGTETSAAFMLNVDTQFNRVARALQYLVNKTEHQIKSNGTTPLNALLPRFFKNHDCLLCPGNMDITMPQDSGHTMVVDFLAPPTQEGFYSAAADFLTEFKTEKVRPHWAKRHDNIPGIAQHIQDVYGGNIEEFNLQKQFARLDPCDMFMNSYLLNIFGKSRICTFRRWWF